MRKKGCRRRRSSISAYLDNELSPRKRLKLQAHLAECKECREYLSEMAGVSQLVRLVGRAEPGPELVQTLKKRLYPLQQRTGAVFMPRWRPVGARWAVAVAAVALVAFVLLFGALYLYREGPAVPGITASRIKTPSAPPSPPGESVESFDQLLSSAKARLLAEVSSGQPSESEAEGRAAGLQSRTGTTSSASTGCVGRVVHSVYFDGSARGRPPVYSHIVYVSYGN